MNEELKAFLIALTERIGGDPDEQLTPGKFAARTGVSTELQKIYRNSNPIIAAAYYPVGKNDWRITMRRWWAAQDELSQAGMRLEMQTRRKAA